MCYYTLFSLFFLFFPFSSDNKNDKEPISSMPGVYRYGINRLHEDLQPLISKGLQSILLFGVSKHLVKVNT